jgi:outer membrane protein assembly factor BamB
MRPHPQRQLAALLLFALAPLAPAGEHTPEAAPGGRWPGFRGVGTGHTRATCLPLSWSEEHNQAWEVALAGYGQSSPVVWDGVVFVSSAVGERKQICRLAALRLSDGVELWARELPASVEIEATGTVSRGAPTPAVDADRVYAFFESGDLFAFDHRGELLWQRSLAQEFGPFQGNHGVASSPCAADGALLLLADHAGPSWLLCVDGRSGEDRWKRDREPRVSWTSPVLAGWGEERELLVSSNGLLEGIDLQSGARRWALQGIEGNTVASPTALGGRVLLASSKAEEVRLLERGAPEREPRVLWRPERKHELAFASPTVVGERVLLFGKSGVVVCLELESGRRLWEERLGEAPWASPIVAGDRVYVFGKDGHSVVLRAGARAPELLAESRLETGSPVHGAAAVDRCLLLREGQRLRCLRELDPPATLPESSGQ